MGVRVALQETLPRAIVVPLPTRDTGALPELIPGAVKARERIAGVKCPKRESCSTGFGLEESGDIEVGLMKGQVLERAMGLGSS